MPWSWRFYSSDKQGTCRTSFITPDPEYRALSSTTNHNAKIKYTRAKILQTAQGTDQYARAIIETINSANPLSWEDSVELRQLEILAQIPSSTILRIQKILCCLVFVPPSFIHAESVHQFALLAWCYSCWVFRGTRYYKLLHFHVWGIVWLMLSLLVLAVPTGFCSK